MEDWKKRIRINGTNSDYRFFADEGVVDSVAKREGKWPKPLELKLFICPNGELSSLQTDDPTKMCSGESTKCPSKAVGHALLELHQNNGIRLVTDNNNYIQLDQQGSIHLSPAAPGKVCAHGDVELNGSGNALLTIAQDTVQLAGRIELKNEAGNEVYMTLQNNSVTITVGTSKIELSNTGAVKLSSAGGSIVMDGNGISITPVAGKDVTVNGNLKATTINGQPYP